MRNRVKIVLAIVVILSIVSVSFRYNQNFKKYEDYVDEKLNLNFYIVCDYMINSNAVIENSIKNEYIYETDLEYLDSQFFVYLRNLHEINEISKKFKDFDFFSIGNEHEFNWEYSGFYSRIDNLFNNQEYDDCSTKGYQLSKSDLDVLKQSHEYTSKAVDIIKNHVEYYNMFDVVIIENPETRRHEITKSYKEEYLEPWPDNKSGGASMNSISEDGTVMLTPVEVSRYDFPKQILIELNDIKWINAYKEIHQLNIKK